MFTWILYLSAGVLLLISFYKSRAKTKAALLKAWRAFENILPQFLVVLLLIGMTLSILDDRMISQILGKESGALGLVIAAAAGSITLIPGFVAFPLAANLLKAGAGYAQITMFLTTLMMVGIVTLPMETKYFGKRTAILRNVLALAYAVGISLVIGGLLQ